MQSVTFKNRTWDVAAELRFPPDFDGNKAYAAIVCVHPGSSCKGQTAGLYAARLAEQGFVTIAFDAFHLVEDLLTQPIQIIAGSVPGAFGSLKDSQELHARVKSEKDLFIVEGATHYDLYDQPEPVARAVAKLAPFYRKHL